MKRILLSTLCCLFVIVTYAQQGQSPEVVALSAKLAAIDKVRQETTAAKDYQKSLEAVLEFAKVYHNASPAARVAAQSWYASNTYNLACYQNLLGHKEAALKAFEQAFALGYSDYANTLDDSDLQSLHGDKRFQTVLAQMRSKSDMNYRLKQAAAYRNEPITDLPVFTYQSAQAPELVTLKKEFNLDSVAGQGDEISRIKNLLTWAHNAVRHDGSSNNPPSKNARDLIAVCKKENRGVNCRMMATILRDAYQAEGFQARMVTCMPKDTADFDCHVINVVWSTTLNKWIWMDPTFNAYVSDKNGNLLSIEEVRERLINDGDLVLNEDANWNNKNKQTKKYYLGYYMSKNLYWLRCAVNSSWDIETHHDGAPAVKFVNLLPGTFHTVKASGGGTVDYAISNPKYFWQKPAGEAL